MAVIEVASTSETFEVTIYPVINRSTLACGATATPACTACTGPVDCQQLAANATAANAVQSAFSPACVGGLCMLLLLAPALEPFGTNSSSKEEPFIEIAASSGAYATVLAQVYAPSGLPLQVLAYRAAAVCNPGTAGGDSKAPGVRTGPRPGSTFSFSNNTRIALDGTNSSKGSNLVLAATCLTCVPGTVVGKYASGTCTPCASGTSQPAAGATACVLCAAGTYQPLASATACVACGTSTPETLLPGAEYAGACFAAEVGIESAWVVGQSLALSVFWSLRPPVDAGVTDIVAVFLVSPNTPGYERRQLAWTYTSVPSAPEDYSGGGNPGADSVSAGSILLTVPSAGEGTYAVRFFRNSSAPSIQGLVPPGGAILASATYFAAGGIPSPTPPNGMQALPLESPVATFPKDLGLEVDSGGLVCPAGTESPFPSNQPAGGGYAILGGATMTS